ncbi:MAG: hypothetical protein HRT37_04075 [Alteromonadaceae bacterium]|nr:hypothetical protein [Alteromonadaceae bacterium]
MARRILPLIGLNREVLTAKMWMKLTVKNQSEIRNEFERLLRHDFYQLLSAHGTFVRRNAHAKVEATFKKMFD